MPRAPRLASRVRARVLAAPVLVLTMLVLAGCGAARSAGPAAAPATTGASRPGAAAPPVSAVPLPTTPAASAAPGTCPSGAWAYDITRTGAVAWHVTLKVTPGGVGSVGVKPVVVAGVAVFAEGNVLTGIRVSDGRLLWQQVFPQAGSSVSGTVYGLWGWDGSVIAQVGQVSSADRVLSLNPATGSARWKLKVPELLGTQAVTANGVLAMLTTAGKLLGADLSTGKLLWSRPFGTSDGPAAAGDIVVATKAGVVAGFDARTGARLWSRGGMPEQPALTVQSAAHLAVSDLGQNVSPLPRLFPVTGLLATTGRSDWAVTTNSPVAAVWAGPAGIVVATANSYQPELLLIDPATGHVRWRVSTDADPETPPLVTDSDVVYQLSVPTRTGSLNRIVDRAAATGKVRWSMPTGQANSPFILSPPGQDILLVLDLGLPKTPAEVLAVDRATGAVRAKVPLPAYVPVAAVATGGGTLVQSATPVCAIAAAGSAAQENRVPASPATTRG